MLKGIDVSAAQGVIDWNKVKSSGMVDFAIIRSSFGWTSDLLKSQIDGQLFNNVRGCEKNGIPYGFYHYSYCVKPENATKEADYFLDAISGYTPTMGVWLDIEDKTQVGLGKASISLITERFLTRVKAAGYEAGIYSYKNFLAQFIERKILDSYPVWLAEIRDEPTYIGTISAWQYSWSGQIDGIKGKVDLDYFYQAQAAADTVKELKALKADICQKIDAIISKAT